MCPRCAPERRTKMARRMLTEAGVERMARAPEGKRREVPDLGAPGLVLRVDDKGGKRWLVRYRLGGKQRKMALVV